MAFKKIVLLFICISIFSCSEDTDISVARNLQEYIDENSTIAEKPVVAYAANAEANTSLTYIFYYPEVGASDIRYYELTDASLNKNDFINYRRQSLGSEAVFGGKLKRFSRSSDVETWCLVTYVKDGGLRISKPIKLNNISKSTQYSDEVIINYKTTIEPNFTWEDSATKESVLYFQVITDEEEEFISGTHTKEKFFQYYNLSNTVEPEINTVIVKDLVEDEVYNFTMMGINEDNWVNIIIKEQFIPRNLEEYIAVNTDKTIDVLAFAGNANGNKEETYIYFQPIEGAFEYRYYETENAQVIPTDFSNYKRRNLTDVIQFGGKFRRFTHSSSDEVWCLVTYIVNGKLHISEPIKTKNNSKTTEWKTAVDITYPETLQPVFKWADGTHVDNVAYLQVFTQSDDVFLSGTYTTEKTFQYYKEENITDKIHTETPPSLVLDNSYKFYVFGLSSDNWLNLVIQNTFIAE
ncbi:hypothetical protein CW731_14155 [Polaribacter sp. ALD11]|uniref:hypothetical protein n=1 Tax=Polaribacter sp. ALD11 TaxID=2058137 RepID=UPI000C307538|nr:hypothetical protein [Polaribacter sp. ALD11]AUC86349.1 hypothetical protein CW731_14155 [Polaribacter sp. ALD11]